MDIKFEDIFAQKLDIIARQLEDEFILVPMHATSDTISCLFNLNSVGADIWQSLDGKRSVGDIIYRLEEWYDADSTTIEREVLEFLNELLRAGIIETKV